MGYFIDTKIVVDFRDQAAKQKVMANGGMSGCTTFCAISNKMSHLMMEIKSLFENWGSDSLGINQHVQCRWVSLCSEFSTMLVVKGAIMLSIIDADTGFGVDSDVFNAVSKMSDDIKGFVASANVDLYDEDGDVIPIRILTLLSLLRKTAAQLKDVKSKCAAFVGTDEQS